MIQKKPSAISDCDAVARTIPCALRGRMKVDTSRQLQDAAIMGEQSTGNQMTYSDAEAFCKDKGQALCPKEMLQSYSRGSCEWSEHMGHSVKSCAGGCRGSAVLEGLNPCYGIIVEICTRRMRNNQRLKRQGRLRNEIDGECLRYKIKRK